MIATKQEQTTTSRILLVEDDRNFGDVLRSYLEMHGFTVDLAVDGIDRIRTIPKGRIRYLYH